MGTIFKYIPGFRTKTKWKMVIAGIYYLLFFTMLTSGIGLFLFTESIPFVVFYGINAIKVRKKRPITFAIIAFLIMCVGIGLAPSAQSGTVKNKAAVSASKNKTFVSKKSSNISKTKSKTADETTAKKTENVTQNTSSVSGQLKVHYIDVGQGDSILVQNNNQNMLIDTGTNASTNSLISYLQSQNIKKIDYLVLTHPHEDHIGGADAVIKTFDIGTIYMNKKSTTTKTYRDVISAISSKGIKPVQPALADTFKVGSADCIIYGPVNPNDKDLNTYSIVVKLTFGNNKFLFTGDAQASNEEGMINNGYDLSADVLKVGHHGSNTSTSQAFLDKVNPKFAVISAGKNNDYGHPHQETLQRLQAKGIPVYRTDENGTIVVTCNGNNISFNCKPGDYAKGSRNTSVNNANKSTSSSAETQSANTAPQPASAQNQAPAVAPAGSAQTNNDRTVYYTPNGKSYHYNRNCSTLARSKTVLSGRLEDVIKLGKTDPCDKCVR